MDSATIWANITAVSQRGEPQAIGEQLEEQMDRGEAEARFTEEMLAKRASDWQAKSQATLAAMAAAGVWLIGSAKAQRLEFETWAIAAFMLAAALQIAATLTLAWASRLVCLRRPSEDTVWPFLGNEFCLTASGYRLYRAYQRWHLLERNYASLARVGALVKRGYWFCIVGFLIAASGVLVAAALLLVPSP